MCDLALARRSKAQGSSNFLLLDDRLQWVRQEKTINSLNQLLRALPALPWDGFFLASHLHSGHLIASLPDYTAAAMAASGALFQEPFPFKTPTLDLSMVWLSHVDSDPAERWLRSRLEAFMSERPLIPA